MKKITVRVPASSANLGPGFDTLALAYKLYCRLTFELDDNGSAPAGLRIEIPGKSSGLPLDRNNLVIRVLEEYFPAIRSSIDKLKVTIDSDIPLARGLGSSAACIAGTVWAGLYLSGAQPDRKTALQYAASVEGHPDNVAASIFGGLTASACVKQTKEYVAASLKWPSQWRPILVVPDREVSTAHARSVLPKSVTMPDAVSNIQNTALLLMAIEKRDRNLFRAGLNDCLHEPHRQALVPEMQEVRKVLRDVSTLGVVLSGAGSSILVLAEERHVHQVVEELERWSQSKGGTAKIMSLEVDEEGLTVSHE